MPDIQGWYRQDNESERVRAQLLIEGRTLTLRTLSERVLAQWSLDELRNLGVPVIGRDWSVGDRRLPEPVLTLDNDDDYRSIQRDALDLAPVSARTRQQLVFSAAEAGNLTGWPVLILAIFGVASGLGLIVWYFL